MSQFFNIAVCAEIAALLVSLFLATRREYRHWRLFALFLLITLATEALGFANLRNHRPNHSLYNLLMLVQAGFFAYLFFEFLPQKTARLLVLGALGIFLLTFIGEGVYKSFEAYHKNSRLLLSGIIVALSCLFYFSMMRQDIDVNPLQHPPFWVITGLFFYYFGTAVMFSFYDRVSQIKFMGTISFYHIVTGCLSCILYGSWIIAFIWRKRIPLSKPS